MFLNIQPYLKTKKTVKICIIQWENFIHEN